MISLESIVYRIYFTNVYWAVDVSRLTNIAANEEGGGAKNVRKPRGLCFTTFTKGEEGRSIR